MPQTPSGILSLPLGHLRTLVAASDTFQTWVGAADATEALDSIYLCDLPKPASGGEYSQSEIDALMPYARVQFYVPDRGGSGGQAFVYDRSGESIWEEQGKLLLEFAAAVDADDADSPADAILAFTNELGPIITEMADLAGTSSGATSYLNVRRLELWDGPGRLDQSWAPTIGDAYGARFLVVYGL